VSQSTAEISSSFSVNLVVGNVEGCQDRLRPKKLRKKARAVIGDLIMAHVKVCD
jgi:hypothetical protein